MMVGALTAMLPCCRLQLHERSHITTNRQQQSPTLACLQLPELGEPLLEAPIVPLITPAATASTQLSGLSTAFPAPSIYQSTFVPNTTTSIHAANSTSPHAQRLSVQPAAGLGYPSTAVGMSFGGARPAPYSYHPSTTTRTLPMVPGGGQAPAMKRKRKPK